MKGFSFVTHILGSVIERINYEAGRAKKTVPFLVRLGVSELEELYHRFNHWRGACDHIAEKEPRRKPFKKKTTRRNGKAKAKNSRQGRVKATPGA